jgi:ergothioneine biosynthesis protein EgtB
VTKPSRKLPWMQAFQTVRKTTKELCRPLAVEDYVIQSVLDVSPPKWHLAHTTWFFETFILLKYLLNYQTFDPQFHYLFNSYYHGVGEPFPRQQRGLLSRPTVETVYKYRDHVDKRILDLIDHSDDAQLRELETLIILGIHHEQQHQELLLMDIKHNFSVDPNFPAYQANNANKPSAAQLLPIKFYGVEGGLVEIGHSGQGFCFDNELPRHQRFLKPYQIANRLVSNQEYCEFIESGGYKTPRWWLADGWDQVQSNRWEAPFYWSKQGDQWQIFTLFGLEKLNPFEPVSHISFFEADAYARWRGMRLPLEEEWEHFVMHQNISMHESNFMESRVYHPQLLSQHVDEKPSQFFGDLWEWTSSSYTPYQGFVPFVGALSEYNGKFMNNQRVLRGGCCVTPQSHVRASYRNFYQPEKRWQFSGIRLAADV